MWQIQVLNHLQVKKLQSMVTDNPPTNVDDLTHCQYKRKLILIIHGIKESKISDSNGRKQYDINTLNSIFANYLSITPIITNTIHLGKRGSKPHLIKISFGTAEDKITVLQNKQI